MHVAVLVYPNHLSKVHQQYPTVITVQHMDLGWGVVGTAFRSQHSPLAPFSSDLQVSIPNNPKTPLPEIIIT